MASPNQITAQQLARLIGTPECPPIVDLCIDEDFALDPRLIPGARRHPFKDIDGLKALAKDGRLLVYCQKGLKISLGTAALLRAQGIHTETLVGGQVGWAQAELPMVKATAIPPAQFGAGSLWVTRHRPKVDRIACPWLLRRFIDPAAQFLFVPPGDVEAVAEKFDATPFDIEGVPFSHKGPLCTFDTMLDHFGLSSPPLQHLARIVRAADTNTHDLEPEAAGLLAASLGFSRMYRDDLQQLEASMGLYDAFYRWARDATDEGHDWPAATNGR